MRSTLPLFLIVFTFSELRATHNRAAEISYMRVAPFSTIVLGQTTPVYNYSITVTRYTDSGPGIADRCVDTVYFGDGARGVAVRVNGPAGSCGCDNNIGCGTVIINEPGYLVKKNIYTITHKYSGPGSYYIRSYDANRNANVINIPNSANQPLSVEALLVINAYIGSNSSPAFANPPIGQATMGTCYYHQANSNDSEGDSLSYEVTPCRGIGGAPVPGYSYPATGSGGTYGIHANTGLLTWCTPQKAGEYNIAILVREWRKNTNGVYQQIGYVTRDMQVIVHHGPLALTEIHNGQMTNIYPSPANDFVSINSLYPGHMQITDLAGTTMLETEFSVSTRISTAALPEGIYLVRIICGSDIRRQKIIVQH